VNPNKGAELDPRHFVMQNKSRSIDGLNLDHLLSLHKANTTSKQEKQSKAKQSKARQYHHHHVLQVLRLVGLGQSVSPCNPRHAAQAALTFATGTATTNNLASDLKPAGDAAAKVKVRYSLIALSGEPHTSPSKAKPTDTRPPPPS